MGLSHAVIRRCAMFCGGLAGSVHIALAQPSPAAAGWGLTQLMHDLAQVKSASGQFTERKTMHVLNAPLVMSGTLTYAAPDRMRKITSSPVPESFVLDRNQATIAGGPDNQTHTFSLTDDPRIGGLVEGIRATLAGDLPTLDRFYIVQLTGSAADWQLLLQPRDAGLARFVKSIRIRGSQNRIAEIDTESGDGDHSEMSIVENVSDAQ